MKRTKWYSGIVAVGAMVLLSGCDKTPDAGYYEEFIQSHYPDHISIENTKIEQQTPSGTEAEPEWRDRVSFSLVINEPLYERTKSVRDGDTTITLVKEKHEQGSLFQRSSVFFLTDIPNGDEMRTRFNGLPHPPRSAQPMSKFDKPVYLESSTEGQQALELRAQQQADRFDRLGDFLAQHSRYRGTIGDGSEFWDIETVFVESPNPGEFEFFTIFKKGQGVIRGTATLNPETGSVDLHDKHLGFNGHSRYPKDAYRLYPLGESDRTYLQGVQIERKKNVPFRDLTLKPSTSAPSVTNEDFQSLTGQQIKGVLDHEDGNNYPFKIRISDFDPTTGDVVGTIAYPEQSAVNKIEGHFVAGHLVFEEVAEMGGGRSTTGSQYSVKLADGAGEGRYYYPDDEDRGTISLTL